MGSINAAVDLTAIPNHGVDLILEGLLWPNHLLEGVGDFVVWLRLGTLRLDPLQVLMDVLNVDRDVADAQHHKAAISLNSHVATLPKLVVEAKQSVTSRVEMASVFVDVEAN